MLKLMFVFSSLLLIIPCQAKTIYVDAYGLVWQGAVWSLGIQSDKAWNPDPNDGQEFVSITPTLSWKAGIDAKWHVIYFGTSFDDVNDSIVQPLVPPPLSYKGYQPAGDEDWDPITGGGLTFDFTTTYYWRIDEGHEELPPPIVGGTVIKGDVWSFTTEAQPIFVDIDAAGANDGTSWEDAYNYLQDALTDAGSAAKPVEIRVAQGIYKPDQSSADPNGSGDRYATFKLINGVTLKGGYAGFGEPDPNERDIEAYETILSGDLNGNDVEVERPHYLHDHPGRVENSYHVVTGSGTDETAIIDGFSITGGKAEGSYPNYIGGGGMYSNSGSPMVTNCTFIRNSSFLFGGGMFNYNSSPNLANCTFNINDGGGMENDDSSPGLIRCVFNYNTGSGLYNYNSNITVTNCIFTGNTGLRNGGGLYNDHGIATITNCTISGNKSGGLYNSHYSNSIVTNCILWDNTPDQINGDTPTVIYSNVQGGWAGLGNIDADPCFVLPGYWDVNGTPGDQRDDFWVNGDHHLKSQAGRWDPNSESWVLDDVTSPCIDAANPGCPIGDEPSPNGNRRNMGAYGGTDEASKSPPSWRSIGDLTNDWIVDSNDLKVFVDYWFQTGLCLPSDFDRSKFVDFNDFAIFGLHWSYPSALEPGIFYQVEDCNMEAGLNQSSAEDSNDTRFSVRVEGNYIHFKDLITANCCLDEIELQMTVEDGLITIFEIEHLTTPCFCLCDYPTTATLGPFEPGIYLLEVIDIDGKSLGIVEVIIDGPPEPGITYQIEDCNLDAADVFAAEPPDLTRFTATVEGPYIHFKDMMTANCCPDKLELEMTVEDNLITIYEIEYTSEGCRCICSFPVTATLGPFEPGIYTLEVYETMGGFIGAAAITIGPDE